MITKRQIFIFVLSVFFVNPLLAQYGNINQEELKVLKSCTTVVVLHEEDSSEYNKNIRLAMNQFWKFNPFIFAKVNDAKKLLSDPRYCFLNTAMKSVSTNNAPPHQRLALGMVKRDNFENFDNLDHVAWFELYNMYQHSEYDFCLINIVQVIQNYLILSEKTPSEKIGIFEAVKIYNTKTSEVKNKTLYIPHEYLDADITTLEQVQAIYKYDVKLTAKEYIAKLIINQDPSVVYPLIIGNNMVFLISAQDGEVLYAKSYNTYKRQRLNKKELEDIAQALK